MRTFYTIIHYLSIPFVLIRLLYRSRHTKEYRKRWNERFAYITPDKENNYIWIHAVSVGETIAAIPLIKLLIQQYYPQYHFLVTTTTPTGSSLVIKNLGDQVMHVYAPFDIPSILGRFFRRIRNIKLCIIMETEMWPNLLFACKKQRIPILLANGRLSERSFSRYQIVSHLTRRMLQTYHTVAAQGVLDAERFLKLGLDPKKLMITGNIKFDIQIPDNLITQGNAIREAIGFHRWVFIAASTHDGEEEIILQAFAKIRAEIPDLFLILAPRHPNRCQKVLELCEQSQFKTIKRSLNLEIEFNTDILLIDTIGELQMIYAAADIAFVGGSLVPIGGHNLIEPAVLGLPILTGPHLHNFTEISRLLQNAGAAQIVTDSQAIADIVIGLCSAKELREKIGQCGKETIEANRGALLKHVRCVEDIVGR